MAGWCAVFPTIAIVYPYVQSRSMSAASRVASSKSMKGEPRASRPVEVRTTTDAAVHHHADSAD